MKEVHKGQEPTDKMFIFLKLGLGIEFASELHVEVTFNEVYDDHRTLISF